MGETFRGGFHLGLGEPFRGTFPEQLAIYMSSFHWKVAGKLYAGVGETIGFQAPESTNLV